MTAEKHGSDVTRPTCLYWSNHLIAPKHLDVSAKLFGSTIMHNIVLHKHHYAAPNYTKLMAWHCSLMVSQVFDSQNFRGEFDHHHHHHHHPLNRGTFGMRNRGEKVSNCENYPSTTKHGTPKEPTVSQGISGFLVKHMKHQFNLEFTL